MKILASDFDDTFCINHKISSANKDAVKLWRERGNKFGICTGRNKKMAVEVMREYNIEYDFLICCTGALILDCNENVIYEKYAYCDNFYKFASLARKCGSQILWVTDNDNFYNIDMGCSADNETINKYNGGNKIKIDASKSIKHFNQCNTWFKNTTDSEKFISEIEDNFPNLVSPYKIFNGVDLPPFGIGKSTGIESYAKLINCSHENILAAGDNLNDITMLKAFEGYAISSAMDDAKKAADYIVDDISQIIYMNM